jgi:hypothetical protein
VVVGGTLVVQATSSALTAAERARLGRTRVTSPVIEPDDGKGRMVLDL